MKLLLINLLLFLFMIQQISAVNTIVFDFDNIIPTLDWPYNSTFESVSNPIIDSENSTTNAGLFTHTGAWGSIKVNNLNIDTQTYNNYQFKVFAPNGGDVEIQLLDANDNNFESNIYSLSASTGWQTINQKITAKNTVKKVLISLNFSQSEVSSCYLDEMIFFEQSTSSVNNIIFNYDDTFPTLEWPYNSTLVATPNPVIDSENSTKHAGLYTHTGQWGNIQVKNLDIDTRLYSTYKIKFYSPEGGKVEIQLIDENNYNFESNVYNLPISNVWQTFTHRVLGTNTVKKITITLNSSETTESSCFMDEFVFIKDTTNNLSLYFEPFVASWSLNSSWTGQPSWVSGQWKGNKDLSTPNDSPLTIMYTATDNNHSLLLTPTSAPVSITDININNYDAFSLKFDSQWMNTVGETYTPNVFPIVEYRSGTGSWQALSTNQLTQNSWETQNIPLPIIDNTQPLSLRFSPNPTLSTYIDNVTFTSHIPDIPTTTHPITENSISIMFNQRTNTVHTKNAVVSTVYNINGNKVFNSTNSNLFSLDYLPKGIYIIISYNVTEKKVIKIIKSI